VSISRQNAEWPSRLTAWFQINKRAMPWRETATPYNIWISEIMCQQTQVATVIPYFERFIKRFPTVQVLAEAELQTILKCWEGLGYYSRARNLHKGAKMVVTSFNGKLPETYEGLQTIPGIGPYCAAAIVSIAFGKAVPVVDGNVLRVMARYWGIESDIRQGKVRDEIFHRLTPCIQGTDPSDFNQGLMELGALLCSPKNPQCQRCPLIESCFAFNQLRVQDLPFKSPSKQVPHYHIAVGLIWKGDKVLIAKRKETQMLGGLWEFPGGKQKNNEALEKTVIREIKEETSLAVTIQRSYGAIDHAYTHFKITLHAFDCRYISGRAQSLSSDEVKWIHWEDKDKYPFPTANKKVFRLLEKQ